MPASLARGVTRREAWAWAMYDFANSGYTTVVITAVFSAYFVAEVAGGADWATLAWTSALSLSYALVILGAPLLGAYADAFACKNKVMPAMYDGMMMGLGFGAILILLGAVRELVGTGALFANMDLLFGEEARHWKIVFFEDYNQFLVAILPPGAFIVTGLIIAMKNVIDDGIKRREALRTAGTPKESRRVRVTGNVS